MSIIIQVPSKSYNKKEFVFHKKNKKSGLRQSLNARKI
jgi:hypothetical protein